MLQHKITESFNIVYSKPVEREVTGIIVLQVGAVLKGNDFNNIYLVHTDRKQLNIF